MRRVKATSEGTDASPELARHGFKRCRDRRELETPAVSGVKKGFLHPLRMSEAWFNRDVIAGRDTSRNGSEQSSADYESAD